MKWRWVVGVPLLLLGGCTLALGVAARDIAEHSFNEERETLSVLMRRHNERYIADSVALASLSLLAPRDGPDAGAVLGDKLASASTEGAASLIPSEVRAAIGAHGPSKWPGKAAHLDVASIDTAWMAELARSGRWDPYRTPAVERARPLTLHRAPLPNMLEAATWARVRLLQGLRGGMEQAGRDVEELARLLLSTENSAAEAVAVTCLRLARSTWEHAQAQGIDTGAWLPPTTDALAALERVLLASKAYVLFTADPAWTDVVMSHPATTVGRCAALQQVGAFALHVRSAQSSLHAPAVAHTMQLLEENSGRCRFTALAGAWRALDQRAVLEGVDALCDASEVGAADCILTSVLLELPLFRDLGVALFASDDPQSLFQRYGSSR